MSERQEDQIEELLLQYTYNYGMRHGTGDKRRCYAYIKEKYEEAGFPVAFGKLSAGITRMGYCVCGDLKNARRVFIAPFDTQRKTYLRAYRFYPFREKDAKRWTLLALALEIVLELILALAGFGLVLHLSKRLWAGLLCGAVLFVGFRLSLVNIFNFSASAPLALMHYIALHCARSRRYAFVFLDKCAENYLPLKLFLVKHKEELETIPVGRERQIYFLSNLAHSQELVLAGDRFSPENEALAQACGAKPVKLEGENRPLCLDHSSHLYFLTAADRDGKGRYYVKDLRCKRDRTMDVKRLKAIAQAILGQEKQQ